MAVKYIKKASKTPETDDHKTQAAVQDILNDIAKRKEVALKELNKKFDKYDGEVIVSKEKIEEAIKKVDQKTKDDVKFAHDRIKSKLFSFIDLSSGETKLAERYFLHSLSLFLLGSDIMMFFEFFSLLRIKPHRSPIAPAP